MKATPQDYIQSVVFAMKHARDNKSWVVIVTPDDETSFRCKRILAGAAPDAAAFSGRTMLLGDNARVSVTAVGAEDMFVPDDETFYTLFVGWSGQTKKDKRMARWYQDSGTVLRALPM